jgi:hypothetical protein
MSIHHATRSVLPPGRSFDGRIDNNKLSNTYGMFYVPTDLDEHKVSARIDAGTIFDVSMGVSVSRYECTICSNDWRSPKCNHWPGQQYNVGTDEKPKMKECFLLMKGAEAAIVNGPFGEMFADCGLSETSVVTDGAVPGAGVVRGAFSMDEEKMEFSFGDTVLTKYQAQEGIDEPDFSKYNNPVVHLTLATATEENEDMADVNELAAKLEQFQKDIESRLGAAQTAHQGEITALNATVTELTGKVTEGEAAVTALKAENDALRAFAAEVLTHYRVKLEGNGFDAATAKNEYTVLKPEEFGSKLEDLRTQVTAKFSGGRTTEKPPLDDNALEATTAFDNLFRV